MTGAEIALGAMAAGSLISTLMAPKPKMPETPAPAVMPDPDDQALRTAARRKAQAQRQQHGRLSTDNTSDTKPLSTTLG